MPSVLSPWRRVRVEPVAPCDVAAHSIHAYFTACPESPDGQWVLYAASTAADGETVDLTIRHRHSGEVRVLARDQHCEDAHRVACQQWIDGGRAVVWHSHDKNGRWRVWCADVAPAPSSSPAAPRCLAEDRLLGWGAPTGHHVPLYGPHWIRHAARDLELLDVRTGSRQTALTAAAVVAQYPEWIAKRFAPATDSGTAPASPSTPAALDDLAMSIFFPVMSPDERRVMFKMARPTERGDWRDMKCSIRDGLVIYDLATATWCARLDNWGHPAWHPAATELVNAPRVRIDVITGATRQVPGAPRELFDHPGWNPTGDLIVADAHYAALGDPKGWWQILFAAPEGNGYVVPHRFAGSGGATSWRVPHPHPVFSADGQRVYINIPDGPWTRLHVLTPDAQ